VQDNQVTNMHLFTTKCLLYHGWIRDRPIWIFVADTDTSAIHGQ